MRISHVDIHSANAWSLDAKFVKCMNNMCIALVNGSIKMYAFIAVMNVSLYAEQDFYFNQWIDRNSDYKYGNVDLLLVSIALGS